MLSFGLTVLLDGVSYGMILFLISVGLTVTMGLMRVVNLAHGAVAMIGGYVVFPAYLTRPIDIGFRQYPAYRLFLIASGALIALSLWLALDNSLYGARLRAAVDNPRMARAVGINVSLLFTSTFVIGCGLAGLGGALGSGILSLEPAYALKYVVLFLIVVIVGGEGSFEGSFVAAMALGIIDTLGKYFVAEAAPYLLYTAVFALLLWRPKGLIPPRSLA